MNRLSHKFENKNTLDFFYLIKGSLVNFLIHIFYFGIVRKDMWIKNIYYMPIIRGKSGYISIANSSRIFGKLKIIFDDDLSRGILKISDNFRCEDNIVISPRGGEISIGPNCFIGHNSFLQAFRGTKIEIGKNVLIASGTNIIASNHNFSSINEPIKTQDEIGIGIVIEDDVWIGANVTILDGIKIGKGSVIAAGSVVTKNIDPYSIAGGIPAKQIKSRLIQ
jgi:acetyltransferase-like isoleucine patch superfamily enzyme